ncbi:MAG: tRNA pseudouridine(54/55) synthase Pus10, partial [Candidatus Aenigmatarchaeota archaeon]
MNISKTAINVLGKWVLCDNCLGRIWAQLLSGTSNKERGKTIRRYVAMLIDSGEKIEINEKNLYGIKLRNFKNVTEKEECYICKNFFEEKIYEFAKKVLEESKKIEFKTFLIGSIIPQYMTATEEKVWEEVDIEGVESIKSEINREIGKIVKKLTGKNFEQKNPDVTFIVDLNKGKIKTEIRSLYVFGEYKKLSRGIPQTKWVCSRCKGKGCEHCRGKGKLYPTSVQEIIENPFLKYCKSEKTRFSGAGREDID